jgi:hypothetical protein
MVSPIAMSPNMAIIQAAAETVCINRSGLDGLSIVFGLYIDDCGASGVLLKMFRGADRHGAEKEIQELSRRGSYTMGNDK